LSVAALEAMAEAVAQLAPARFEAGQLLEPLEEQDGMALSAQTAYVAPLPPAAAAAFGPAAGSTLGGPAVTISDGSDPTAARGPPVWHENDAYTKVMWLRNSEVAFVKGLLAHEPTGTHWEGFMEEMKRPALVSLHFCLAVGRHARLEGDARRQSAFAIEDQYLCERETSDAEQLEELVTEEYDKALKKLAAAEYVLFLASYRCTKLIHELRRAKERIMDAFLFPDTSRLEKNLSREQKCFEHLKNALRGCSLPVMLCDRSVPGLPIVGLSAGVSTLTGYAADELLGQSCRMLQGPKTEVDAVVALSAALRAGTACRVTLCNYTKLGTQYANVLAVGATLRPTPDGTVRLIAAVLQAKPRPMNEERSMALADSLLAVLGTILYSHPTTSYIYHIRIYMYI